VNRPRRILLILYVSFAAALFTFPLERPDPKSGRAPLKVEVRCVVVADSDAFTARVRFQNLTPRPISLPEPQDTSWQCCPYPVPVMVFAAFPDQGRGIAFPGLIAETAGNHKVGYRARSPLRIGPYSWIDLDFKTLGPLQVSHPLTFWCYYVSPRTERAGREFGMERDGTFFGTVKSDPLLVPARKVGP
jgi:hypothetical protein